MSYEEDSAGYVGPAEFHQRLADALRRSIRTATPGVIHRYSRTGDDRCTADVELPVRPDGEEQAVLSRVPVMILGGGDGYLVFPHERGDTGLVVCCDTEIGRWRVSGDVGAPADEGRLGLSGAVMIPGLRPRDRTVDAPAGATVLAGGDVRLGDSTATEQVLCGNEFDTAMGVFVAALKVWADAAATAVANPAFTAATVTFKTAADALETAIGNALSPTVRVED